MGAWSDPLVALGEPARLARRRVVGLVRVEQVHQQEPGLSLRLLIDPGQRAIDHHVGAALVDVAVAHVVVGVEAERHAEARAQEGVGDERRGGVALLRQETGEPRHRRIERHEHAPRATVRERELAAPRAVTGGKPSGQERPHGGERPRRGRERAIEDRAALRPLVERRRGGVGATVDPERVGAQRVDHDQDDRRARRQHGGLAPAGAGEEHDRRHHRGERRTRALFEASPHHGRQGNTAFRANR